MHWPSFFSIPTPPPPPPLICSLQLPQAQKVKKKKNHYLRSSLYCAVFRPGVCSCACEFWSLVSARRQHNDPWHFLVCQCCMLLINLLIQTMHRGCHWFSCWLSSARLTKHTFVHALTLIDHSVLAVLCQYLRGWQCNYVCTVNVRLHFALLPVWFWCENKIACVICLGRTLQNKLFCHLLVENLIVYNDWRDDLFWCLYLYNFHCFYFSVFYESCVGWDKHLYNHNNDNGGTEKLSVPPISVSWAQSIPIRQLPGHMSDIVLWVW